MTNLCGFEKGILMKRKNHKNGGSDDKETADLSASIQEKPGVEASIPTKKSETQNSTFLPVEGHQGDDLFVKKGIEYVQVAANVMTLPQRKMMNVLLWNAYDKLLSNEIHSIPLSLLKSLLGMEGESYFHLKEVFKSLGKRQFEWNILDPKGKDEWGFVQAIAGAKIKDGMCYYSYAAEMREMLMNPRVHALLEINQIQRFQSSYALALYENVMVYFEEGVTPWFKLDDLKRLLGVPEQSLAWTEYKIFNRDILKPAINEINRITQMVVTADDPARESNRRVSALRFKVIRNPQNILPLPGTTNINNALLNTLIVDYSLPRSEAAVIIETHLEAEILAALKAVDGYVARMGIDQIKDLAALTRKAVKDGRHAEDNKFVRERLAQKSKEDKQRKAEEIRKMMLMQFDEYRWGVIVKLLSGMSEKDQVELNGKFSAGLDKTTRELFERSGRNSPILKGSYKTFLLKHFAPVLPDDAKTIEDFIKFHASPEQRKFFE